MVGEIRIDDRIDFNSTNLLELAGNCDQTYIRKISIEAKERILHSSYSPNFQSLLEYPGTQKYLLTENF